jgi:NAD(P)-dependent dehydrogenase (short-subunit alcohol dehydrogenase family)
MKLFKIFNNRKNIKKNILITGCNSGLGLELVKIFLKKDYKVVAIYNKKSNNLIKIKNNNLFYFKCNLENIQNINLIRNFYLKNQSLYPQIIVNNAGFFGGSKQSTKDLNYNNFVKAFKINCIAVVKIISLLTINLKKNQLRTILNVSSIISSIENNYTNGNFIIYKASKAALNSITRTFSSVLKEKYKINTFLVHPGNLKTNMNVYGNESAHDAAKKIFEILASNCSKLNGRFIDLKKKNINW